MAWLAIWTRVWRRRRTSWRGEATQHKARMSGNVPATTSPECVRHQSQRDHFGPCWFLGQHLRQLSLETFAVRVA